MTKRSGAEAAAAWTAAPKTVAVLQPGYLPWLGFFDQMCRADLFVYYDDVQFDKHGWRNRNRLKSAAGPIWVTVPVRHAGLGRPRLLDIAIDNTSAWPRKHIGTIRQLYAKAPYLKRYLPQLEELLHRRWNLLVDLDAALIDVIREWLGLDQPIVRSSTLGIDGVKSERLVKLCLHFGASRYLSGDAAQGYLDVDLFRRHDIELEWQDYQHPVYPQQHGPFVPYLSVLDLLLNCGDESAGLLSPLCGLKREFRTRYGRTETA